MLCRTIVTLLQRVEFLFASAARAGDKYDSEANWIVGGGFRIGPFGQPMGRATACRVRSRSIYRSAPRARLDRRRYYER